MTTGMVWTERSMWHDSGNQFGPHSQWLEPMPSPESADSKRRIRHLLDASGLSEHLTWIAPEPAGEEALLRVHSLEYLQRIRTTAERGGGNIGTKAATHIGANGYELAALAAGGAIRAVDAVIGGQVDNAYVLMRPPGHHAERSDGKGFCIFNNAAVAARHAQAVHGLKRIALVDWDAHHGNGAQQIFWDDPTVLAISIHQERAFPQSIGSVEECGAGAGLGYTLNIPLPPGSGEGAYLAAMDDVVAPALKMFEPDLIIVPCGFDAGHLDPTARMLLTSESFRRMTMTLKALAAQLCGGRLVFVHEGGYALQSVPFLALATLEALSGHRTQVNDPFLPAMQALPMQQIQPHQTMLVEAAAAMLRAHPPKANR
jgi:acetoin utilization deacetylase AcuC-like enzyme